MISDAYVLVTCDRPGCSESVEIGLEFNYPDYSGRGGRYDHRPEKVLPKLKREGWTVVADDDTETHPEGLHYCENCSAIDGDSEPNPDTEENGE